MRRPLWMKRIGFGTTRGGSRTLSRWSVFVLGKLISRQKGKVFRFLTKPSQIDLFTWLMVLQTTLSTRASSRHQRSQAPSPTSQQTHSIVYRPGGDSFFFASISPRSSSIGAGMKHFSKSPKSTLKAEKEEVSKGCGNEFEQVNFPHSCWVDYGEGDKLEQWILRTRARSQNRISSKDVLPNGAGSVETEFPKLSFLRFPRRRNCEGVPTPRWRKRKFK